MPQIPILNGIYVSDIPDVRVNYPRNLLPVSMLDGVSAGYLRPAEGVTEVDEGPGTDRGGINWQGEHYRVMGSKLVHISSGGVVTTIGDVGTDGGYVTLDYSFEYLSITSATDMYLYDGITLTQITDSDLGDSLDHIWVDGYFMSTDGEFVVVTDLADPFSVDSLKYGSAESDPDPIEAILKVHNEPFLLNRYTTEVLQNIGGTSFPFGRVDSATIQQGVVGTHACCVLLDSIIMVGGGRNENISVWGVALGNSQKVATREVERILNEYTETQLSAILVESRIDRGHQLVYIHLPDKTLVYDFASSKAVNKPVWFVLTSSTDADTYSQYLVQNFVRVYDGWYVGDPSSSKFGVMTYDNALHWGATPTYEFSTQIIFNDANSAIIHELELTALSHEDTETSATTITTQYSEDGQTWSTAESLTTAIPASRNKKLGWVSQGSMQGWRIQRFRGDLDSKLSFLRLDARIEGLQV
jgi:hypothetical protein